MTASTTHARPSRTARVGLGVAATVAMLTAVALNWLVAVPVGTGVCPANTASLKAVQQALGPRVGRDIFMYSLSLRPEFDSPEALRAEAKIADGLF